MLSLIGCSFTDSSSFYGSENSELNENNESKNTNVGDEQMTKFIILKIKNQEFLLELEDNSATKEFVKKLPLTISFSDYGGFEKVGSLGFSLPRNDEQMTTNPGDVVLYNGNNIVVFYGNNSWSYTKIGHVDDVSRLVNSLSESNIEITFQISE